MRPRPAGHAAPVASQVWFGGLIELAGGVAVLLGAATRPAALLCSGTMAMAYLQFHWKFHLDSGFWPTVNKGELALLYCFVFLHLACQGGVLAVCQIANKTFQQAPTGCFGLGWPWTGWSVQNGLLIVS